MLRTVFPARASLLALVVLLLAAPPLAGAGLASPAALPCEATVVNAFSTSDNIRALSVTPGNKTSIGEIAMAGERDIMVSARYREASGGLDLWNVSDPTAPVHLSGYAQASSGTRVALDVKTSTDGMTAFIGQYGGIELVDIRDPTAPVFEGRYNFSRVGGVLGLPSNMAHMMSVAQLDGVDYVFVATQWNYGIYILEVVGEPGARKLRDVALYMPFENPVLLGQHDVYVAHDPVLDKPLLYVANGFEGWAVADISDIAKPVTLAIVPEVSAYQGYTHTVQVTWLEGRRIVATISEIGHNSLKVYDATDLALPVMIAEWNWNPLSPVDAVEEQHNIQIVDGKLVMSHKWQGVFVFDLAALVAATPPGTVGVPEPLSAWGPVAHWQPPALNPRVKLWDVVVKDGLIFTGDYGNAGQASYYGVYVLQYGCWAPGDGSLASNG